MSAILLVDDQATVLHVWAEMLRRGGHHVCTAASVQEARANLNRRAYDLVILDLDLPDGSGQDVFAELRSHSATAPVIAVSEVRNGTVTRSLREVGYFSHLSKPVRLSQLESAIQAVQMHTPPPETPLTLSA